MTLTSSRTDPRLERDRLAPLRALQLALQVAEEVVDALGRAALRLCVRADGVRERLPLGVDGRVLELGRLAGDANVQVARVAGSMVASRSGKVRSLPVLFDDREGNEPTLSKVSNSELRTIRYAMRESNRMVAPLERGEREKFVLTQRIRCARSWFRSTATWSWSAGTR